ncbi:sortase [Weissella oryzae SG25]|uniref:Sortase n=1 Tax=Weissella oryzae (strain DSM 25784 / JCM 18191 / LMG 30913 / SG25) TaxID=1329250 RepID=A0A069CU75_WEIOS|nr:class A sortase [Weissella oryzae]GAK31325.1 sortase [Weissella oryzae SG25]
MVEQSKSEYSFYNPKKDRWWRSPKKILIGLGTIVTCLGICVGLYYGYAAFNNYQINQQVSANQKADAKMKFKAATAQEKEKNQDLSFTQNDDIPDAKTIQRYRALPEKLNHVGLVAVPIQKGVTTPIKTTWINEGSSNKVLASGAGTIKGNQVIGIGNFAIEAHTVKFGNNTVLFSPMQHAIDVNKTPKVYLTDGKKIFVYEFYKESDPIKGRQKLDYSHGEVASDSRVQNDPLVTMSTCDEEERWDTNTKSRIIMTGHLVSQVNKYDASDFEKSLFPQIF